MLRIAVVNSKGGVGKTTTAVFLAAAATAHGARVEVVDLDKQGSAASWLADAALPASVTVRRGTAASLHKPSTADVQIIDTSPGSAKDIDDAAAVADFVVIPTMPGRLNDERTLSTWNYLLPKKAKAAILLIGIEERRVVARKSREVFDGKADLFEMFIPNRTAINQAAGTWPKELFGYDKVLKEIEDEING